MKWACAKNGRKLSKNERSTMKEEQGTAKCKRWKEQVAEDCVAKACDKEDREKDR